MSRIPSKTSEWDVLKKHHKFQRPDDEPGDSTWEDRLAKGYESKLFRELALIDLKHYKSKRFALRWRTATEVVDGKGDETHIWRCESTLTVAAPFCPISANVRAAVRL
ncbi:hypothetical protein Q8F55_008818 [Vanrija albida]|uniref:Uncharacterized protein n=1 Tax=Vanrija albida TaxID=181172 RepID=A0ABR3PRX1_9TREE